MFDLKLGLGGNIDWRLVDFEHLRAKFTISSLADVINTWLPAQVACKGYTKNFCLIDYLKGWAVREVELWEEI